MGPVTRKRTTREEVRGPSQTIGHVDTITLDRPGPVFFAALGPFLGNHAARREIGAPIEHREGKTWIVALIGGEPVGCAAVFLGSSVVELGSAYVLPEHRGRGIYACLIDVRLRLAAGRRIRVIATEASAPALLRRGFVEVGQRGRYHVLERAAGGDS